MQATIFTTPVISHLFYLISWIALKLSGWRLEGHPPEDKKYVLVAVPHTSNWDFPITLAFCFVFRIKIYWMGKASLFKGVCGPIMRFMGGISVDRSKSTNTVDQVVAAFDAADEMVVTIPVEGTRGQVERWRTGFYYIALGAKVPIGRAFLDYKRKMGGFLAPFQPTGDIEADMAEMKKSFEGISGRYTWTDGKRLKVKR